VPTTAASPASCGDPRASYRPIAGPAGGPTLDAIRKRGKLVVGVGQSAYGITFRDPTDGNMTGFEIDIIHEIARRLLGSPDDVTFIALNPQDWPHALRVNPDGSLVDKSGPQVDMVLGTMTMNCDRWASWSFSTEYLHTAQRLLVNRDSPVTGLADLGGRRVCSSTGSTNLAYVAAAKTTNGKPIQVVSAPATSDCMAMLQEGQVAALTTADVNLAGFAAQDRSTKIADIDANPPIASVPCGIGMKNTQIDLIRFVNGVLADIRGDGLADRSHTLWTQYYTSTIQVALQASLGSNAPPVPVPPNPLYRD
jgi:polar amino acid transport system substrate-binding protein